ncbi:CHAT domain-containing tetratricopeptide repeat protein [Aquimarina sp. 2201CG5-10]|uniref:CHAT domain-containing protein n=1 Tax=Aquimarina callyspongiae TaxID=3098150 RepID=UPI002AB466D7|nr:CHAT domain-containing tetratricopeptide repeat protein [Aquimarina sp. 2201CG5-10]MDY8136870.1 CHAT domain-containing tetratricopeptide repeat protein [Aquimarina sp. 2201CG5-10]
MFKRIIYLFFILSFSGFSQEKQDDLMSYFQKGSSFLYTNKDSLQYYFDKATAIANEEKDVSFSMVIKFYLVQAAGYHYDLEMFKRNLDKIDSVITNVKSFDTLQRKNEFRKNFLFQNGNYNFKTKNYTTSKDIYEKLAKILSKEKLDELSVEDRTLLFSTYNYLASINELLYKNQLAKDIYEKNLDIASTYPIENSEGRIAGVKMRFARIYENEENYVKANELLTDALSYYITQKDNPRSKNSLLSVHQRLAKNYLLQDSTLQAITILKESEAYYLSGDAFERSADLLYGDIYLKDQQYQKAETYYESYLTKIKHYRNNQKHQDVTVAYSRYGELFLKQKQFDKSLKYYQLALQQLSNTFDDDSLEKNPNPREVFSKLELIKTLKQKLAVLQKAFKAEKKLEYLKTAHNTSSNIIETLDLLKPEFESKVDKQFLISEMYPAFHGMVEVAYDLYEKTKDQKYVEDAFRFIEKSKSVLLLEATRNAQANFFGGVSEDVLTKEQQYRAKIIHQEKKLYRRGGNKTVSDSLFALKNGYYDFIKEIEQNYPEYYNLKYNDEVITLQETQDILREDTGLISYFTANDNLYIVTVQKNANAFYRIPFDKKIQNTIVSFYEDISTLKSNQIKEIYKSGNSIYQKILNEPIKEMDVNRFVVLKDGVLNYLPFEALSKSLDQPEYLIQDYQISYANSATILKEQKNRLASRKSNLLAYAPHFGDVGQSASERSDFGPLIYNTKEVENIMNYFDGKAITGADASIQSFIDSAYDYTILHFATHAAANDKNPDYSYLAFTPDHNNQPNLLYVKDLYGYTIDADLVTLSACQTGLGKLQAGEGMLSLARGFNYAGARSLLTTLWKVNDQTTAELMSDFYKNLGDNLSKDKALREAKLNYLNTIEEPLLKHPYYWAGFVISGDMTPLEKQSSRLWWALLLLPILLIILIKRSKA